MNKNKPGKCWMRCSFDGLEAEMYDEPEPASMVVSWPILDKQKLF